MKGDEGRRTMRSIPLIATLITLTGCPGPVTPFVPDSGPPDSGPPDAGPPDAGLDCTSPGVGPDAPCGTLAWATSPVTVRPRNHHSSAIAAVDGGTFLYVL